MKFLVINGSPRGKYSITLQSILYLEALYPEHEFEILNVGINIKSFSKDMTKVIDGINNCDCLLFSFPVYTFLAPSQLHIFINLLKGLNLDLSNKFASSITTSKHFYDYTAHQYILDNMQDMNIKYIKGLSLDMDDLLKAEGRKYTRDYFNFLVYSINNNIYEIKPNIIKKDLREYKPLNLNTPKLNNKRVVIVADLASDDLNLKNMILDFENTFGFAAELINIHDFNFKGGCIGCFNCAGTGKCIYNDGFDTLLRERILTSNAIVYAFTIKDHSMGSIFKTYDDRQFCNGHRTVSEGISIGYIINGDIDNEANLKAVIEARADVGHNYLAGIGNDNFSINNMARKLEYGINNQYLLPRTFLGVGGMKIFRDLIWVMRGLMKEDHKFYKQKGLYDFPQKERPRMLFMCLVGAMMRNQKIKAKMGNRFNEEMVKPYRKVIDGAKNEKNN